MDHNSLTNTQVRGYLFKGRIGQGTFGNVYRATHLPTETEVAIKVINVIDSTEDKLSRHLLMISRELYILQKMTKF